jgi:hypothetical protein
VKWKIDKGLDIPPVRYSTNNVYRELIADMEEGDSIGGLTQAQATGLAQLMRKHGIKAVSRKMVDDKVGVVDTEPVYRVWHNGPLEKADKQPQRIGSPTDTVGIDPDILQQAEAHEDRHNIVEDTKEVFKKINDCSQMLFRERFGDVDCH